MNFDIRPGLALQSRDKRETFFPLCSVEYKVDAEGPYLRIHTGTWGSGSHHCRRLDNVYHVYKFYDVYQPVPTRVDEPIEE